jgi:multicomponent Na+:H+ antiporter subunit D
VVQRHRRSRQAQRRTVPIALAGAALAVGALALADLPPFTSSMGKDLLVGAAGSSGWWVETVIAVTVILSSAAILRAAVLSWTETGGGGDGQAGPGEERAEDSALSGSRLGVATLIAPPVALLAVALGIGMVPHLDQRAVTAAARFSDRSSYAVAVLGGKASPAAVPATTGSTGATFTDLLEAACAVAVGAVLVARQRRLLQLRAVTGRAVLWLRHLHTGHVGDQLTWQLAGAAALAGLVGMALR